MTRLVHVLRELARNIYRHPGTALASVLSLALIFLLFDLFWIAAGTSNRFYDDLVEDVRMEVFVREDVPEDMLQTMSNQIEMIEGVAAITYLSKDEARAELERMVGTDLLVGYDTTNPLPRSYILTVTSDHLNPDAMQQIAERARTITGVEDVFYSHEWLEKAESARDVIREVGMALGLLILLAALIGSYNNIRLMTQTRAVGFRQMFLLGAGKWFVAAPFVIEGFIISALASGLGWLVLFYARSRIELTQIEIIFPEIRDILMFCAVMSLLGLFSGYLGIRRYLR